MIKAGLSLLFLVIFGVPFLFLFIALVGAYPIFLLVIPFVVLMVMGAANK